MAVDIPALASALSAASLPQRRAAAQRLAESAADARPAAVPLVRAAADADEELREAVVAALEGLGPPDDRDLPALAALLNSPAEDCGYWAATLLGRSGPAAVAALPGLVQALAASPAAAVRQRAAWALGRIGPAAAGALDALGRAAADGDPRLARLARESIELIQHGA